MATTRTRSHTHTRARARALWLHTHVMFYFLVVDRRPEVAEITYTHTHRDVLTTHARRNFFFFFFIRMPPRQHELTPVMRSRMVDVGDVITAINGQPMLGLDTSVVANALQTLPACVNLRLVKYGFDFVPTVAQTQVCVCVCVGVGVHVCACVLGVHVCV